MFGEHTSAELILFFILYGVTGAAPFFAAVYLLFRRVISIVIIVFLLWRVETLQELPSEEDMDNWSLR